MDNIVALIYLRKMRRNKNQKITILSKEICITFKIDYNYYGVPTQFTQRNGGLEISSQYGLIRMGSLSTCLSQSLP